MSAEKNMSPAVRARRDFLVKCGKFAAVTPPVMTLMLSAAHNNYAVATSGLSNNAVSTSGHGNNGFGNGGNDGVPGNSGNNRSPNAAQKKADKVR